MKNFRTQGAVIGEQGSGIRGQGSGARKIGLRFTACMLLAMLCSPVTAFAADDFRQRVNQGKDSFSAEEDVKAEIVFGRVLAARILGKHSYYENEKF